MVTDWYVMCSGLPVSNGSLSHSLPALVEESEDRTDTGSMALNCKVHVLLPLVNTHNYT